MKEKNLYFYSLIAPLMIALSIIGFTLNNDRRKFFYLPLGIIGLYSIVEKEFNRRLTRKSILKKVKSFPKHK